MSNYNHKKTSMPFRVGNLLSYTSRRIYKISLKHLSLSCRRYLQVDDSEEAELQRELKALSDPQKVLSEARKKWKHLQNFVYIPKAI